MLTRFAAALAKGSSILAGAVLVLITGYTIVEIVLRTAFGAGTNVLVEFVGYGLAAMTFLGAAQTMREGGLIRVNVVLHFVPPRARQVLDMLCIACGIAVIGLAAGFVFLDMQRSFVRGYETDSLVALPLWLPPLGLFVGMVVFVLDMIVQLLQIARGKATLADESPEAI